MPNELGGDKPWQVNAFAGQKGARMQWYRFWMLVGGVGAVAYWVSNSRQHSKQQDEAADRFGQHGEKTQYGSDFQSSVSGKKDRFPGIPTTETNARGQYPGGPRP